MSRYEDVAGGDYCNSFRASRLSSHGTKEASAAD